MRENKKILVVLCIVIAAILMIPDLKIQASASILNYEEWISVEYGEDINLTPDISNLNLPDGFEIGWYDWVVNEKHCSNADNYILKNVTESTVVKLYVADKDHKQTYSYTYNVFVNDGINVKAIGDTTVIADSGEKVTFKVSASCKNGSLTYKWMTYNQGFNTVCESGPGATSSYTFYVSADILNSQTRTKKYICIVSDEFGHSNVVQFDLYVNSEDQAKVLNTNKFYILTSDDSVDDWVDVVAKKYPEYTKNVEVINLGLAGASDDYYAMAQTKLKNNPDATIIVVMDVSMIDRFASTGVFAELNKLGLSDCYSQSYPYTRKAGTYKGKLIAMTPEAVPGTFMYDPDIAKKVLGTSEPEKIQNMLGTADGYLAVAAKMKKAGYYMTSGAVTSSSGGAVGLLRNMTCEPIYSTSDDAKTYMLSETDKKIAKRIADETGAKGYDTGSLMWGESWRNDMASGKVFGWFSCTWAVSYSITFDKQMSVCQGPIHYSWGGSYLTVKSGRQDAAAVKFLKALCTDTDVMVSMRNFPNNTVAAQKLIKKGVNPEGEKGKPVSMKNNQNLYMMYDRMARSIDGGSYKLPKTIVAVDSNGIVKGTDGIYYYVLAGKIQTGKSGFYKVGQKVYYISKGVWQNKKTGFVKAGKKTYYVKRGVRSAKNEFVNVGKKTYYLNKGVKNTKTGFVKIGNITYYVRNGLKTNLTALIKNGKKYYYVKNGVWKKSFTGKITYKKHKYYVKKGVKIKMIK